MLTPSLTAQDAPPAPSICPRCGAAFGCGAAQPGCACGQVKLTAAQRADLAARYQGCLCLACLRALVAPATLKETPGRPKLP